MQDYYDFRVGLMDTESWFSEIRKTDARDRPYPCDEYQIDDEDTEKRWQLRGVIIGPGIDRSDLQAMLDEWGQTDGSCVTATVEDNGTHGDGLWLSFRPNAREGDPKSHPDKWGDNRSDHTPRPFFQIRLTPKQAGILGAALTGVAAMRKAQEDE